MNHQPDHDEQWLRDGLAAAVPDPPANPARAEAAAAQAGRRRRTTIAVAGAVAAVVVIAGLSAALGSGSGTDQGDPATVPTTTCPAAPDLGDADPLHRPDPGAPATVPPGAVSARLCQGGGTAWDAPEDALVTDVEDLVEVVNGLEASEAPEFCPADLGRGYRIVFGYDDGREFVVSGRLAGCRDLVVGSGYRADGVAPWEAFIDLLRAQRDELTPPGREADPVDLDCATNDGADAPVTSPVADPGTMTTAVICLRSWDYRNVRSAPIPAADLRTLMSDLRANTGPFVAVDCLQAGPRVSVRGVTGWGDVVEIHNDCGYYQLEDGSWKPGPEAAAILEDLRAAAEETTVDVGGCPVESTLDYAAVDEDERDLPDEVPPGATSVRLCVDGETSFALLTEDVDTLVDTVNGLPPGRGACTDEGPRGYRLAFWYPDRTSFVVAGLSTGCGYVVVGSGYRDGPEQPLTTFIDLLREQRETALPPAMIVDARDLDCDAPVPQSIAALADPADMVAAKLCIVGGGSYVIPAADVPRLAEDYRTHQGGATGVICRGIPTRFVGITKWGDRFSLYSECGYTSYELPTEGDEPRYWNLSPEARRLLDALLTAD